MALAILHPPEAGDGVYRFRFDLGRNRWYAYAIGDREIVREHGLATLANPRFTSELIGPLPPSAFGRGTFEIPAERFDRDFRYVQLMSFRTEGREGPAVSEIRQVRGSFAPVETLPVLQFSTSNAMNPSPPMAPPTENTRFMLRERPPVSQAMFLGAIANLLPQILPAAGSLLGGLFGGGAPAGGAPAGGAPSGGPAHGGAPSGGSSFLQTLTNPQTIAMIADLLRRFDSTAQPAGGTAGTAPATPGAAPAATPGSAGPTAGTMSRQQSAGAGYSQAQVAPALLAALPALMPLLQQALNPQTISAIGQNFGPNALLGTVQNGMQELARLGLQSQEQDYQHLRALNPGLGDQFIASLFQGMSASRPRRGDEDYRRVASVTLAFVNSGTMMLHGRERIAYRTNRAISFPVEVTTPRPIGTARVSVVVKHPETLRVIVRRTREVDVSGSGEIDPPMLEPDAAARLAPGSDYLVTVSLVWQNRSGQRIGTSVTELITAVGELSFDRVEESSQLIPLNDVDQHRDFWHKVWQGSFSREEARATLDCKYYFSLDPKRNTNGRMETVLQATEKGVRGTDSRMKSGLLVAVPVLNALIPRISSHRSLDADELAALASPDFVKRFNQAARRQVKFTGRPGDSAALWVYPEVKLQQVILLRADAVDNHGRVTATTEHVVQFPMPALVHFIGARSER